MTTKRSDPAENVRTGGVHETSAARTPQAPAWTTSRRDNERALRTSPRSEVGGKQEHESLIVEMLRSRHAAKTKRVWSEPPREFENGIGRRAKVNPRLDHLAAIAIELDPIEAQRDREAPAVAIEQVRNGATENLGHPRDRALDVVAPEDIRHAHGSREEIALEVGDR